MTKRDCMPKYPPCIGLVSNPRQGPQTFSFWISNGTFYNGRFKSFTSITASCNIVFVEYHSTKKNGSISCSLYLQEQSLIFKRSWGISCLLWKQVFKSSLQIRKGRAAFPRGIKLLWTTAPDQKPFSSKDTCSLSSAGPFPWSVSLSFSLQFSLIIDLFLIPNNLFNKQLIHPLAAGRFYSFISNLKVHLQFIGWLNCQCFIFILYSSLPPPHNLFSSFNLYSCIYHSNFTSLHYITFSASSVYISLRNILWVFCQFCCSFLKVSHYIIKLLEHPRQIILHYSSYISQCKLLQFSHFTSPIQYLHCDKGIV
jgi:hypothetical protein